MGDIDRAGLAARDREGLRPRTTSCLRAEKKPCFFSIFVLFFELFFSFRGLRVEGEECDVGFWFRDS